MKLYFNYKRFRYEFAFFYIMFPFFFKIGHGIFEGFFYLCLVVLVGLNSNIFLNTKNNRKYMVELLGVVVMISLFALSIPVVHSTYDFSLSRRLFSLYKQMIMGMALYCIFIKIKKYKDLPFEIHCINSICIYVISSLFLIYVPGLKSLWRSIMFNQFEETTYRSVYQLRYGLCGYSGIDYSFLCTLGIVFCLIMYQEKRVSTKYIISRMACMLVGNFLYARVGLVTSGAVLIIGFLYSFFKGRIKDIFKWIILFVIIGMVSVYLYLYYRVKSEALTLIFEPIENYIKTGKLSSQSTRVLWGMYVKPTRSTLLFGEGYYFDKQINRNYMQSDVGFVRYMLFGGLLFEAIFYYYPFRIINKIVSGKKYYQYSFVLITVAVVLFELKGEAVMYMMAMLVGLSFGYAGVESRYE